MQPRGSCGSPAPAAGRGARSRRGPSSWRRRRWQWRWRRPPRSARGRGLQGRKAACTPGLDTVEHARTQHTSDWEPLDRESGAPPAGGHISDVAPPNSLCPPTPPFPPTPGKLDSEALQPAVLHAGCKGVQDGLRRGQGGRRSSVRATAHAAASSILQHERGGRLPGCKACKACTLRHRPAGGGALTDHFWRRSQGSGRSSSIQPLPMAATLQRDRRRGRGSTGGYIAASRGRGNVAANALRCYCCRARSGRAVHAARGLTERPCGCGRSGGRRLRAHRGGPGAQGCVVACAAAGAGAGFALPVDSRAQPALGTAAAQS